MYEEKQYIDLYNQFESLIDRHSAPVLNAPRSAAIEQFAKLGFPDRRHEDFKHIDIKSMFAPDYGVNLNRLSIPVNPYEVFRCDVPNLSTALYFLVNDSFYPTETNRIHLPQGVLVGSLKAFAHSHPELIARYYNRIAQSDKDATIALNTALCQDGFFLYIPDNTVLEKPLQLVNVLRSSVDFMVNRRLLIVAGENAQVKLLVCDHAMDDVKFLSTQVCEIYAGKNSVIDYAEIEETTVNTSRVASTFIHQEAGSNTTINGITLHNGCTRNNYYLTFAGKNAETSLNGIAIGDKNQVIDNYTWIDHRVSDCKSNELFKYVLNDAAQGVFSGRIVVQQDAQKTSAFQSNKNLCATPQTKMFTRPQLEIYADDVKCSHGATVGQLDQNALFYMQSRGISEQEARLLLMFAFTNDVIENIRIEALKDRLRQLIDKRFRGELAKCAGCHVCR